MKRKKKRTRNRIAASLIFIFIISKGCINMVLSIKSGTMYQCARFCRNIDTTILKGPGVVKKYKKINVKIKSIKPDEFDWASLGFVIHNVYNLLENYFLRVSKFFENDLDSASWHKDLVNRMSLEIEDVRPRLLDRNLAEKINELRAFRHIFRFIYQSDLDIEKLKALNIKLPEMKKR